ncbi:MAG: hypothetical protein RJB66_1693 [Pseudomonadota bacterium]|jgi:NDP-sugar pyrophosphorylase family protein
MINILVPLAGKSRFFSEAKDGFPKPLVEILGMPMVQHSLNALSTSFSGANFIFVLAKDDCERYHLDKTIDLILGKKSSFYLQDGQTAGAACSCLLAIDEIDNDKPLVVCNPDQKIDIDLTLAIEHFINTKCDAGVITFNAVHPQWSYVRIGADGVVCEAAEKNPISKNAIAGFYYFRKGSSFVRATQTMILKDARVNQSFYIAPCLNELILDGALISNYPIPAELYHSFYSYDKIKEFEAIANKRV